MRARTRWVGNPPFATQCLSGQMARDSGATLRVKVLTEFADGSYRFGCETESSRVAHLACCPKKCAQGCPAEPTAPADALDAHRRQFNQAQLNAWQAHQHIYRPLHRADNGSNVVLCRQTRRVQYI